MLFIIAIIVLIVLVNVNNTKEYDLHSFKCLDCDPLIAEDEDSWESPLHLIFKDVIKVDFPIRYKGDIDIVPCESHDGIVWNFVGTNVPQYPVYEGRASRLYK